MVRRTVAFGAGLLVLILLVLGVRGCLDSRREAAITDYVADVDALMKESNQLSTGLFEQLQGGGETSEVDAQNSLNSFRSQAVQLVDRADALDAPGDLEGARGYVLDTLEFRAQGVEQIAASLPNALSDGDQQEGAAEDIAQAMQLFLASDQIYASRVRTLIHEALNDIGVEQPLANSVFLQDLGWLDPAEVASRLSGIESSEAGEEDEEVSGVHGTELGTVTLGGVALVPGGSASVPASGDLTFEAQVTNQGESTETDITVTATVGSGSDAIEASGVIKTIAVGEAQTVPIELGETPPTGQTVPVTVEVELVDGEDESIGNNSGEYSVIFTS